MVDFRAGLFAHVLPRKACVDTTETTGGPVGDDASEQRGTIDDIFKQRKVRMGRVVFADAGPVTARELL